MNRSFLSVLLIFFSILDAQTPLGNFSGYSTSGNSVTLRADTSCLRLVFYTSDIVRVDYLPSPSTTLDSSFAVVRGASESIRPLILELDSSILITSTSLMVACRKFPLRLSFSDSSGYVLLSEPRTGGPAANRAERAITFSLNAGEHFYGTGERGTRLDKRGLAFDTYNTQVGGYATPLPTMNLNVPFIASTRGYALYIDNTYKGHFDLGASDSTAFSYTVYGGEISYYFIAAPTIARQLERYTWLTGRQHLPPRWAFGFIQSKNRYMNEAEARAIVDTIRTKNIPCDALVLDLQWFRNMGDLSWDRALWPNPEAMMSDFRLRGIKTILITEPYIVEPSGNFDEAAKLGYLAKDSTGKPYLLDRWWSCGGCNASLLDLTMPAAAAWWWKKHPAFLGSQVAGIWTDLGEPERHPRDMLHFLGSAGKIHNIYNLIWAKIIYEGLARYRPGERIFNLTRSGFAGIQRYGVIPWSGDVARDFGGLAVQLPMLLNMGMSGIAYHNSDIGGYARNPTTPELYVRWMQYGTFCPITRAHGAGEVVKGYPTEPWRFGPEAEKICKSFIELRYRLIPYIYTLAHENYATGIPLARPLFWEDPGNRDLFNESSAYFWGDAFVVSPVVKAGETSKEVYLPEGRWFDFWTDKVFAGGKRYIVAAPIDIMPLFVRGGSIIPMAPTMEYTDERPLDTLTLLMYPPTDGESAYTLYEDDGKTNAYESGSYGLTTFTLSRTNTETGSTLNFTIGSTRGSFNGKIRRRVYIAEIHSVSSLPSAVIVNGTPYTVARNASELSRRNTGFYYDTAKSIIIVPVACNTESVYQISLRGFR